MISKVEDHVEQAQGRFIEVYQEKPRLAAWLASYTEEAQECEDMLWDVVVLSVMNAEGAHLDAIGKIVGEKRRDRTDAVYRLYVLGRIRVNWSQGNPDDVIEVLRIIEPAAFRYVETYPASFEVQYDALPTAKLGLLADVALKAKEAGVSGALVASSYGRAGTLQFTYGDGQTSSTVGLAGPDATTGGRFANLYKAGNPSSG